MARRKVFIEEFRDWNNGIMLCENSEKGEEV